MMNPTIEGGAAQGENKKTPSPLEAAMAALARLAKKAGGAVEKVTGASQEEALDKAAEARQVLLKGLVGKGLSTQDLFKIDDVLVGALRSGEAVLVATVDVLKQGKQRIDSGEQQPDWVALAQAWLKAHGDKK